MRKWSILAAAGLLAAGAECAPASVIYGVGPFGDGESNLYTLNPLTGAATLVGPTGAFSLGGLAVSPQGTLYAYNSGLLFTLDPATGRSTRIARLDADCPEGGLSFQPATGLLYGLRSVEPDALITINLTTGHVTHVGLTGARDVSGLAFSPQGDLYGAAFRAGLPDQLVKIDPDSGLATAIGALETNVQGISDPNVGGLDFSPETGILYYSDGDNLYTVNTATGLASLIGPHGLTNLAGLAVAVPEPGTAALLLAGAVGALMRRVRKAGRTV